MKNVLVQFIWIENSIGQKRLTTNEPPHDKTNKMVCAPSEDSDSLGISVFADRMKKTCVLSYPLSAQRRH